MSLVLHVLCEPQVVKATKMMIDWADAEKQLAALETVLEDAKTKPVKPGDEHLAKQNGTYDMRRRPWPALRKQIAEMKLIIDEKREDGLWQFVNALLGAGHIVEGFGHKINGFDEVAEIEDLFEKTCRVK